MDLSNLDILKEHFLLRIEILISNAIQYGEMVEKANITPELLGEKILESLNKSRESEPVNRSEIKDFKFWQISGIKGRR